MLPKSIRSLIVEEQARQGGRFVEGVELEEYLTKLGEHAEVLADSIGDRCRGFVAYYCNELTTKQAYITLVLVDPRRRAISSTQPTSAAPIPRPRSRGSTRTKVI